MDTCHLPLWALNHVLLQLLTLSAPWNEFRVREQKWGTLCSGKNWQNRFSDGQLFQESTLWAQFLYLSIYKKTLKSFRVTIVPGDYKKPSAKKKKKKNCLIAYIPFHQNHKYTDLPITSLEQFLRAAWVLSSGYCHFILPKIKLNSQLSRCAFFLNLALVFWVGFPGGSDGKEICLQWRRPGFTPWVKKSPWSWKWWPIPIFLPGELHGQRTPQATVYGIQRVRHNWMTNTLTFHSLLGA